MPATPQTSTGMPTPRKKKALLVTTIEVIAMVITIKATREAEEGEEASLPVEEVNSQAGISIHTRERMTQCGHIAKILILPVAAPPKTAQRSTLAVKECQVELFAIRKRTEEQHTRHNTDL